MRTLLRALVAIALAAVVVIYAKFWLWRADIISGLASHSVVVQTARGPIEYATIGTGYPALFLHGTPGGYDQVYEATKLAIERGQPQLLRVIAPSRPGYLRTPLSVGATPEQQADAFKDLLDVVGVDKVVVFGGSGGGPSALRFVLQYPERCAALVLASAITQRLEETPPQGGVLGKFFQTEFGRWLFGGVFLDNLQRINPTDTKVRPLGEIVLKSTYPFAARAAGRLNDGDQYSRLARWPLADIKCPTLIVHGTADTIVPFAHAQFAHEQIVGSRLEAFEGGDHFISVAYSTKIDALVAQFVAAHVLHTNGGQ
ncbi:MAG: alpha/beta fold hydrolase [Steroidobacteraceae bacterium]